VGGWWRRRSVFVRPISQSAEIGRRRFLAHGDCGPWHVGAYPPEII